MQAEQGQADKQREVGDQQSLLQHAGHRLSPAALVWIAGTCGIALCAGAAGLVWLGDLRASAAFAVPLLLTLGLVHALGSMTLGRAWPWLGRRGRRAALLLILLCAALLRIFAFAVPPSLSDDVYRYRWDGKVQAAGHNPYLEPPASSALEPLRDETFEHINYPRIRSIYPPLAQQLFALVYRVHHSVAAFRAAALLGDVFVVALLWALLGAWQRPAWLLALYACHPLPVIEFASSGHFDAWPVAGVLAALLAAARGRTVASTLLLAAAVLLKTWPLVFVPLLLRRRPRWHTLLFAGALLAGFAPYAGAGVRMLHPWLEYAGRWRFNDGAFWLLAGLTHSLAAAKAAAAALGLALLARLWQRRVEPVRGGYWLLLAFIVLMPTVHPWYLLWALPLAAAAADLGWLTFCWLAPAAYWILVGAGTDSNAWIEPWWPRLLEYVPAFAVWVAQTARRGGLPPAPGT